MSTALTTNGLWCGQNASTGLTTNGLWCPPLVPAAEAVLDLPYVHITQIVSGDEVRLVLFPGRGLDMRDAPHKGRIVKAGEKPPKKHEKTVVKGTVYFNNPQIGKMRIRVPKELFKITFNAEIPYRAINRAEKVVPAPGHIETATQNRPGGKALGTIRVGGYLSPPRMFTKPILF